MDELSISGIGISRRVIATVVSLAAERVEGVASVGGNAALASSLISVFTKKSLDPCQAVEAEVAGDRLHITIHLAVFYGYPFTELAANVRSAVAECVEEQIGVKVASVDVCIDSLVFPKE